MEAFGRDYTVHNLPLLILSGLDAKDRSHSDTSPTKQSPLYEGGFRLRTDVPTLDSPLAQTLRDSFLSHDGSQALWTAQSPSSNPVKYFKIKTVGRTFTLPPRKAPPPPHSPRLSAVGSEGPPPPLLLHSPLSPLTPSSPLYPDGVITPLWITKHQDQLPSALLVFFTLTADSNTSSLLDNKIKNEVNAIRAVLSSTNYKTRLAVVLLADGAIDFSDIEDRLSSIRKAANLSDSKSLYFLPNEASSGDVAEFTKSLLSSLHQPCVEYYRDLSKHARRKRNRNTTPQPTIPPSNGHPLHSHGWNARYEFKLGVFAEFRQEMDAACRNYESAYESLFMPEMIDAIASWSPRFNQSRLLSDVIALRILRCLLWTGQTTNAVRTWTSHRDRTQELIDRRGKGTENYGWEAWQSTWAKTMADLISRSAQPALNVKILHNPDVMAVFAGTEKALSVGERISPWENLGHQGYWLEAAQNHTQRRRNLAQQMPPEDRQPPGRSPASAIANKAHVYDTYLTLEPHAEVPLDGTAGYEYMREIVSTLEAADSFYAERGQVRMRDILSLKKALEYLQAGTWTEATLVLYPLWKKSAVATSWVVEASSTHRMGIVGLCKQPPRCEMILRLKWELANQTFTPKPDTSFDMRTALEGVSSNDDRLAVALDVQEAAARVMSSFAFVSAEGHVGEPLDCQFILHSCARAGTQPLSLAEAKVVFEGALKPIYVGATETQVSEHEVDVVSLSLEESSRIYNPGNKRSSAGAIASLSGQGDLTLAPGQTRVFNLQVTPREAGEVTVASITLMLEEERFSLTVTNSEFDMAYNHWWEHKSGFPLRRDVGPLRDVSKVQILPKPPKVEIHAKNFRQAYYANEEIQLDLVISNNEEEAATVSVETRLISPVKGAAKMRWKDTTFVDSDADAGGEETLQSLPIKDLSTIQPSSVSIVSLIIFDTVAALDHELEVAVTYNLGSDNESILRKVLTLDIAVIRPFEANYDFTPKFDSVPWPSFFSPPIPAADSSQTQTPQGLLQKFLVTASLVSFAADPIVIEGILLTWTKITGGALCSSTTGVLKQSTPTTGMDEKISTSISPEQTRAFNFSLSIQKLVLGDRHSVSLDLALEIGWRRPSSEKVHTTILEVPRFIIPTAEPRVLLTSEKKNPIGKPGTELDVYILKYLIENASMHFLTFNINMESSDDFAFSGPKACAIGLVPMSKQEVKYRIFSRKVKERGGNGQGEWVRVQLNVVDAYFNQSLRVQPAVVEDGEDERVKVDKKGGIVILFD